MDLVIRSNDVDGRRLMHLNDRSVLGANTRARGAGKKRSTGESAESLKSFARAYQTSAASLGNPLIPFVWDVLARASRERARSRSGRG